MQHQDNSSFRSALELTILTSTGDEWRGKSSPTERRRIQNRLNQRARRQRQRANDIAGRQRSLSEPQQEPSGPEASQSTGHTEEPSNEANRPQIVNGRSLSAPALDQPGDPFAPFGLFTDELSNTIRRNLMHAAISNACYVGIDPQQVKSGGYATVAASYEPPVPTALTPVQLQYEVPHDPIIDTLPHPRLRNNILLALAAGRLNEECFCAHVRQSGALITDDGTRRRRCGLVVWGPPEVAEGWEMSEDFVQRWAALLKGCEDLLEWTNQWRRKRAEQDIGMADA